MPNIIYQGEVFYLSKEWGWLNADFIAVPADLQVKINQHLISEASKTFGN